VFLILFRERVEFEGTSGGGMVVLLRALGPRRMAAFDVKVADQGS
jgi:hypothetical protein